MKEQKKEVREGKKEDSIGECDLLSYQAGIFGSLGMSDGPGLVFCLLVVPVPELSLLTMARGPH